MKAVITVTGRDSVGIIAKVSTLCSEYNANIVDITQSVMSDYFAMIMLVEIDSLKIGFFRFCGSTGEVRRRTRSIISAVHEDIFNTMHHI